jgi:hypothetical protein
VAFDESGDRINAEYHVINVHPGENLAKVGQYFYSSVIKIRIDFLDI